MTEKKKWFRLLPLFGGFLALTISFIATIPIGSLLEISMHILRTGDLIIYIWGIVEGEAIWFGFTSLSLENLIPLIFWILLVVSGISGIIGTSYKQNPRTVKKLLLVAGFTLTIEIAYFTIIFFLNFGLYTFGIGYYSLLLIIILYFLAAGLVTDYQKI